MTLISLPEGAIKLAFLFEIYLHAGALQLHENGLGLP